MSYSWFTFMQCIQQWACIICIFIAEWHSLGPFNTRTLDGDLVIEMMMQRSSAGRRIGSRQDESALLCTSLTFILFCRFYILTFCCSYKYKFCCSYIHTFSSLLHFDFLLLLQLYFFVAFTFRLFVALTNIRFVALTFILFRRFHI